MKLKKINEEQCRGYWKDYITQEDMEKYVPIFAKYLKIKKYRHYIDSLADIHITTKNYMYTICQRGTYKFIIIKEELKFNAKRWFDYVELIED